MTTIQWWKVGAVRALGSLIVVTLVLYIVYGAINGWLIPKWAYTSGRPVSAT